jgi:hypothetical protein
MPSYEVLKSEAIKSGGKFIEVGTIVTEAIATPRLIEIYLNNGTLKKIFTEEELKKINVPFLDQNKEEHLLVLKENQIQNIFRILQCKISDESKFKELLETVTDSDMLIVLATSDIRKNAKPFYTALAQKLGV